MPLEVNESKPPGSLVEFWRIFCRFLRGQRDFTVVGPVNLPTTGTGGNRVAHFGRSTPKMVVPVVLTPATTTVYPTVMVRNGSIDSQQVVLVTDLATDVMLLVVF